MADYITEEEQSPQVVSKRKKSGEHQWTDSVTYGTYNLYVATGGMFIQYAKQELP